MGDKNFCEGYEYMKYLIAILMFSLLAEQSISQNFNYSETEISDYFNQVKIATEANDSLWNKNIYGPILLVDPNTREVYANVSDADSNLVYFNGIYRGVLPQEIPVSNTDINWGGTHWAMLLLPLPEDRFNMVDLMTHELFHRAQPSLGFEIRREDNQHLDLREGRIYLRLEIEALNSALYAGRLAKSEEHLRNALLFRKYRQMIYRGSQVKENSLEMLEGIATYTGQFMSGRDKWQWREYLLLRLEQFEESTTYVRSFAYETIPVYGFFLHQKDYYWNKKVDNETDLTDFFSEAYGLETRILLQAYIRQVAEEYGGRRIFAEEFKRAVENEQLLEEYRIKFFENPRLEIRLEDMNMSFDPRSLIPLDEDEGTVYPTIMLSDNWGILNVTEGGVLLRSDWRWIVLSEPLEIAENKVIGDGWIIELNEGYFIEKMLNGDYLISKKAD